MAGTAKVTLNKIKSGAREVWEIICDWAVDSTGTIQQNIAAELLAKGAIDKAALVGNIIAIETIPGANGNLATTSAPAIVANHTYLDAYSFDIGEGVFINQATITANKKYSNPPMFVNGEIQLNVASVGSSTAQGRDILWLEVSPGA